MNICEKLESIHPTGKVVCGIFHGSQILPRKERLKKYHYCDIPNELWLNIDLEEAEKLVTKSICYRLDTDEKILDENDVVSLIKGFFSGVLVTNYDLISHSSLDVAVFTEAKGVVGIICVVEG